jgi:hypothetical protein
MVKHFAVGWNKRAEIRVNGTIGQARATNGEKPRARTARDRVNDAHPRSGHNGICATCERRGRRTNEGRMP